MNSPPDAVYAMVRDTDPDVLDADGLAGYTARIAELTAWCDARQVRATRRHRQLASEGRAADPRSSLAQHGRRSSKDAAAAGERESVCTAMPGFEDALGSGAVAAGHVDAVAAATRNLDAEAAAEFFGESETLLGDAERQSVDAFAKNCRDLAKSIRARHNARSDVDELDEQRRQSKVSRWVDKVTGMHHTHIECDPVSDRQIWSAVQRERGRLRARACEADIIPVVLNGDGVVLDEGRAKRLATYEQRLAIEAMHTTCSHPDCTVSIDDCRIHHLRPWSTGGRTDLADLAPVCETHHHLIHEGGWSLTMTPDRSATWVRPDGIVHWTGSLIDRRTLVRAN